MGFIACRLTRNFFRREIANLFFNFGSLQLYEGLLLVTAVFLARRFIW